MESNAGSPFSNLQVYKEFAHQADHDHRRRGLSESRSGDSAATELFKLAKEKFHLEMLHLEVYATNPAINLYKRMGFREFGIQEKFIKENGVYKEKL